MYLDSGIKGMNGILNGGLRTGLIMDLFGRNGSGKSQICFTICANLIKKYSYSIVFVDTLGTFRPERIYDILCSNDKTIMKKISIVRPTTHVHQIISFREIEKAKPKIIIIDNIAALFSLTKSVSERHFTLKQYLHNLSYFTIISDCLTIITNMTRNIPEIQEDNSELFIEREFMARTISIYTQIRLQLSNNDNNIHRAKMITPPLGREFSFIITNKGVETYIK